MASGDLLTAFLDFDKGTGPVHLGGPTDFIMDAADRKFLWGRLANGESANAKRIQGGKSIQYHNFLSRRNSFEEYLTGGVTTPTNTQHMTEPTAQWRFARAHKSYADPEIILNDKIRYGGNNDRYQEFTRIAAEKNALLYEDLVHGVEGQLWAQPNTTKMEGNGSGTQSPYSIMSIVNEDTSGLWGSGWSSPPTEVFTTKLGLTPGTAAYGDNFKPQKRTYGNFTANDNDNVFAAFDHMAMDIHFDTPVSMAEYWEKDRLNKQMIITSRWGRAEVQTLMRAENDHYRIGKQDPAYPDPTYYGIPITFNDSFGAGAYYEPTSGSTPATETAANITGPRYLWLDGNHLCPVINSERFFYHDKPEREGATRPDTWVVYVSLWWNLVPTSIKRQGIVAPDTDITAP